MNFFLRALKQKRPSLKTVGTAQTEASNQMQKRRGHPDVFLNSLAGMLKIDLDNLARDPELFDRGIWQIKLQSGQFESSERNDKQKKKSVYIFLSVPNDSGFLLETVDDDPHLLRLVRAKQVTPLLADFSGAVVRPNIIVAQGQALETYDVIEDETVRSQQKLKTLSVERLSEQLITMAFEVCEVALKKQEEIQG